MAPSGTPRATIVRLNADVARALAQPDIKEKLLAQGLIAAPGTPEQLAINIREDYERLVKVIKATGIQLN
jgi:tripartite-type tricarboxylate transporter receptor subunit TctC